jgi:EAL domain-containing protein (putative c-di-GMP-specific phosphodiesterase class I)
MMDNTLIGKINRSSTTSIGITIFNNTYTEPQEMLRDADSAMYRAKAQGGGRYQIFDVEMYKNAVALLQLEAELKQAMENNEWQVYYQPIISLASGTIAGVEALVRWNHPQRGIVSPAEFISTAEESGLIVQIGEYVLREACRHVKTLREIGYPEFWVSVNLSGRQFQDQNLLKSVEEILTDIDLPGDCLRLEVTETVAMKDIEYSAKILRQIEQLGIHISLDDFGNGYSSFGYLRRFSLKSLKIDRSFIRDMTVDNNSEAITAAIISLAHTLDLDVIAEGVETEEQLNFLKSQICDEIQGFLFSRPLPAEELGFMLKRANYKSARIQF